MKRRWFSSLVIALPLAGIALLGATPRTTPPGLMIPMHQAPIPDLAPRPLPGQTLATPPRNITVAPPARVVPVTTAPKINVPAPSRVPVTTPPKNVAPAPPPHPDTLQNGSAVPPK